MDDKDIVYCIYYSSNRNVWIAIGTIINVGKLYGIGNSPCSAIVNCKHDSKSFIEMYFSIPE